MTLTPAETRQILDALAASDWDEAVVTIGDVTIAVARNGGSVNGAAAPTAMTAPPAGRTSEAASPLAEPAATVVPATVASPATAPSPAVEPVPRDTATTPVTAPSVGVFWRSPSPGAAPFVDVGSRVAEGDTLGIVEVMKLMNNIQAPCSGVVVDVLVENAAAVEYDDVLLTLAPDPV